MHCTRSIFFSCAVMHAVVVLQQAMDPVISLPTPHNSLFFQGDSGKMYGCLAKIVQVLWLLADLLGCFFHCLAWRVQKSCEGRKKQFFWRCFVIFFTKIYFVRSYLMIVCWWWWLWDIKFIVCQHDLQKWTLYSRFKLSRRNLHSRNG